MGPLTKPDTVPVPANRSVGWSLATLFVGILALTTAVLVHLYADEPKPQAKAPAIEPERLEGGIRLEWKGIKAHFGGKQVEPAEPIAEAKPPEPADPLAQRRRYRQVTAAFALIGLAVGPLAFWRESTYALSGPGMAFCFLALTWQSIIAGITIGVAVAILLLLLSALA